ncbi:hypothetical protein BDZ97DRAFT_144963 [Flammula alnicola]|nr:hypothetical protein BDZ97DRAFT_144963 [Flammula alnicola]
MGLSEARGEGKKKEKAYASSGRGQQEGKQEDRWADYIMRMREEKEKVDYASKIRMFTGTQAYHELALIHLQADFPHIPESYLRESLQLNRRLYVPTHLSLAVSEAEYPTDRRGRTKRPYTPSAVPYDPTTHRERLNTLADQAFSEERAWLSKTLECQCCFSEYPQSKLAPCPFNHLFCSDCISRYASTKLGEDNASLECMHSSGCAEPYDPSVLPRVLPRKLLEQYERVQQRLEIEQAGIEGLEECPFCEFKCVMEVSKEEDSLFWCANEEGGCGLLSCRLCKKKDHRPKSCMEAEHDDLLLNGRHAIEEAMTRALMRNCPKCSKAFIKESGCNKMTCPKCGTQSRYVCRQVVKNNYDHFDQMTASRQKCLLFDKVEERHAAEVREAEEKP